MAAAITRVRFGKAGRFADRKRLGRRIGRQQRRMRFCGAGGGGGDRRDCRCAGDFFGRMVRVAAASGRSERVRFRPTESAGLWGVLAVGIFGNFPSCATWTAGFDRRSLRPIAGAACGHRDLDRVRVASDLWLELAAESILSAARGIPKASGRAWISTNWAPALIRIS